WGKRSNNCAATSGASVSPQKRKRCTFGSIAASKLLSARHNCAKDGVETQFVTCEPRRASYKRRVLATCALFKLYSVPPLASDKYKSITERSNENGAWFKKISPARKSCSPIIQSTKLVRHSSVITTPFGSPVLPDVKII